MKRAPFVLIPAVLLACASAQAVALQGGSQCAIPDEFTTTEDVFPRVKAAIAAKERVNVLAIGSATTVGQDLVPQGTSFPYRMVEDMQAALPGVEVKLTVGGGRGLAAAEMLELLRTLLRGQHFALVVWQTGTVEAVRAIPPVDFQNVLTEGTSAIRAQGGDVLLVDPQFSRFLQASTELDPYEKIFRDEATRPGVIAFRRFDLMRKWAETGELDLEHVEKEDRAPVLDRLHRCLGTALSRLVLAASGASRSTP